MLTHHKNAADNRVHLRDKRMEQITQCYKTWKYVRFMSTIPFSNVRQLFRSIRPVWIRESL